jgi:hypothetical protein
MSLMLGIIWIEWMIALRPNRDYKYKVHEGNPRLQYYNNTLDYYTLNTLYNLVWLKLNGHY